MIGASRAVSLAKIIRRRSERVAAYRGAENENNPLSNGAGDLLPWTSGIWGRATGTGRCLFAARGGILMSDEHGADWCARVDARLSPRGDEH